MPTLLLSYCTFKSAHASKLKPDLHRRPLLSASHASTCSRIETLFNPLRPARLSDDPHCNILLTAANAHRTLPTAAEHHILHFDLHLLRPPPPRLSSASAPWTARMKAAPLLVAWHDENAPIYSAHFEPGGKGRLATAGGDHHVRVRTHPVQNCQCSLLTDHSSGRSMRAEKRGR
jgi:hypothetical protein